ncbi:MAG: VWA domain-containing protein [Anaerolineae bacterium]|nr:VWA domain-containing protein [Anaerolineae bacterium]
MKHLKCRSRLWRWHTVMAVVLSCLLRTPVYAQHPPTALFVSVNSTDVETFPEVTLAVTVRDANGVPVPDLEAFAFEINEDRAPISRPILAVETMANVDFLLSVVVVVDVSGSMEGQPLEDAQAAARALVDQLGANDRVAFIAFADAVNLDVLNEARESAFTADHATVVGLIDGLEATGSTPLYDALYKAVLWAQEALPGNRAIILLSDGIDEGHGSSVASAETPIQEAIRAGVPIFTIALGDEIDQGYLERVARVTGGDYQEAPDSAQLTTHFLTVLDQLKQQYVLTYVSGLSADGADHRVQVNVAVKGRRASAEAAFGPLPKPEPTTTPTPTLTATPTSAPTPMPTPTATPVPFGVVAATKAESIWNGLVVALKSAWAWFLSIIWWALGLVIIVLSLILLISLIRNIVRVRRARRIAAQEYCASCGRPLAPDEICLECGADAGRVGYMDLSSDASVVS